MSRQFNTLAQARAHKSTVEADMLRGTYIDPSRGRLTLSEYAGEWLAHQTFGPTTRERREQSIRLHILPALGHHRLVALRPSIVQAWISGLDGHLSPRTVRELVRLLSSMLRSAVADERIAKNPCQSPAVRLPRLEATQIVPWTPAQIAALRAELPPRYRVLLTLVTGLGLRQGEAFGLAVGDIDFLRRKVVVRRQVVILGSKQIFARPKSRKERTVPLPVSVAQELASYLQAHPARPVSLPFGSSDGPPSTADLLVTSREGKALNRNYINSRVWKPALRRAGLPDTRPFMMHGGRHLYASLQLEHGVGVRAVADYLGHADPGFMLRTYAHLMPEASTKAEAAVDALFADLASDIAEARSSEPG